MLLDPFAGWTFTQTEQGIHVRTAEGVERVYSREEASTTAIKMILDRAAGRDVSDVSIALWRHVMGEQLWALCLRAAKEVGEAYAEEIERMAAVMPA